MRKLSAFTALFVVLSATAAYAHMHLTGSTPEDGAVLAESPSEIVLRFSEPARVTALTLSSEEGETPLIDSPSELTIEFKTDLPALAPGEHSVAWRAAASDMHVMSGNITFTVPAQ